MLVAMSADVLVPFLGSDNQQKDARSSTMASAARDIAPAEWTNQQVTMVFFAVHIYQQALFAAPAYEKTSGAFTHTCVSPVSSLSKVLLWLERNRLSSLVPLFEDQHVDGKTLVCLDEDSLLDMGVMDRLEATKVKALITKQLVRPRSATGAKSDKRGAAAAALLGSGFGSAAHTADPPTPTGDPAEDMAAVFVKSFRQNVPGTPYALRAICKALLSTLSAKCTATPLEEIAQAVCAHVVRTYVRPALAEPHSHQLLAETVKLPSDKKATLGRALDIFERFALRRVHTDGASSVDAGMAYYSSHGKTLAASFHQLSHPRLLELQYGIDEFSDAAQLNRPTVFISPSDLLRMHRLLAANAPHMPEDIRPSLYDALRPFGSVKSNVAAPDDARLEQHPAYRWAVDEVGQWLSTVGLDQYARRFEENRVTGETLLRLTQDTVIEMEDLGVRKDVHQRQLAKEVEELRKQPRRASSVSLASKPAAARAAAARSNGNGNDNGVEPPNEVFNVPTLSELGIIGDRAARPMALQLVNR
jgi:hypothetical protein